MTGPMIFTPEYYARMRALESNGWWNAAMRDVAARLLRLPGIAATGTMLDVGCGYGRHAMELAARGFHVVGLDLSTPLLVRGGEEANRRGLEINFVRGDMRELDFDAQFDAAYCLFSTFGYFDDETNKRTAANIARALKPGGRVALAAWGPVEHGTYAASLIGPFLRRLAPPPPPSRDGEHRARQTDKVVTGTGGSIAAPSPLVDARLPAGSRVGDVVPGRRPVLDAADVDGGELDARMVQDRRGLRLGDVLVDVSGGHDEVDPRLARRVTDPADQPLALVKVGRDALIVVVGGHGDDRPDCVPPGRPRPVGCLRAVDHCAEGLSARDLANFLAAPVGSFAPSA